MSWIACGMKFSRLAISSLKVDAPTTASSGEVHIEKANYVVNPSRQADARVVAECSAPAQVTCASHPVFSSWQRRCCEPTMLRNAFA